jgi:hypothetical protein
VYLCRITGAICERRRALMAACDQQLLLPGRTDMNLMTLRLSAALVAAVAFSAPAFADDLARQVADGAAWTTVSPTGGSISITFLPDGTGRVGSGLLSRRLTWQGQGDSLCLSGLPGAASGCMVLTKTENGFLGRREDGSEMRLWR